MEKKEEKRRKKKSYISLEIFDLKSQYVYVSIYLYHHQYQSGVALWFVVKILTLMQFSKKMCHSISTLPVIYSLMTFLYLFSRCFGFFQWLNISPPFINHRYLSASFIQKGIQIQQAGEPREHHLGEVRQGTLQLKFDISNHRNFSVNLPIVFIYFYFVLSYLIVLFFGLRFP